MNKFSYDYGYDDDIQTKGKKLIMNILSLYPELYIRDFPHEYFEIFKSLEEKYVKFSVPYDYRFPITDIFNEEELIGGLQELRQERITFIRQTQKYIPSKLFVEFPPIQFGVHIFNELINQVDSYVGILKLEKPDLVDDSVKLDLNDPILNYFHSLSGRDIKIDCNYLYQNWYTSEENISESQDNPNILGDYDRFTGEEDSKTLNKLLKKYNLGEPEEVLEKDEIILSRLTSLEDSKLLRDYISKIADPTLLFCMDNFKDLYTACTTKEEVKDYEFSMEQFYENYNTIKSAVFSNSISNFSPRLVKLAVTIETTR